MLKKLLLLLIPIFIIAWTPATTTVTASWTTICVAERVGKNNTITFKVHNTGSNPFTDCQVESWVGPADTDWVVLSISWDECKALAATGKTYWSIDGNAHEKLRVRAQSTAGTTAYCRPYGN